MSHLLFPQLYHLLGEYFWQFLNVLIINRKVIKVHDKEIKDLILLDVVSSHFVETLLWLQNVVY